MADESDPVNSNEFIFRRVLGKWYDANAEAGSGRVERLAFRPNPKDVDGLSVFRSLFVAAREVAEHGVEVDRYCVAELSVESVFKLGLSVVPDTIEGLPGHCLIPEIRYGLDGDEQKKSKELQFKLASLAGENIVYIPQSW